MYCKKLLFFSEPTKHGKILSSVAKDQYVMNQTFGLDVLYHKLSKQCSQNVADGVTENPVI